eukprot:11215327-Karenia_brevis.AAC.1
MQNQHFAKTRGAGRTLCILYHQAARRRDDLPREGTFPGRGPSQGGSMVLQNPSSTTAPGL